MSTCFKLLEFDDADIFDLNSGKSVPGSIHWHSKRIKGPW